MKETNTDTEKMKVKKENADNKTEVNKQTAKETNAVKGTTMEKETTKNENNQEKEKLDELTNLLKRVQADFENYKKRVERDKADFTKYASKKIILELLPILDHFDLAIKHKENKEEFAKAMEMIHSEMHRMLEREGVKSIRSEGEKYDPYKHEALMQENNNEKDNETITEEFQRGYTMHEEVIRPSRVKVNKR